MSVPTSSRRSSGHQRETLLHDHFVVCDRVELLIRSPGLCLHLRTFDTLASAYSSGLQKLSSQVQEALQFVSTTQLSSRVDLSLRQLRRALEAGERFILSCRCDRKDNHSMLKRAITLGLSTDAVNTHLHDFLLAFCSASDAIGHALERESTNQPNARAVITSRYNEDLQKPDQFWKAESKSHILLLYKEQLDEQKHEDLELLKYQISQIMGRQGMDINNVEGDIKQRLASFLWDKFTETHHGRNIGADLTLPTHFFASFKDVVYGNFLYQGNYAQLHKVLWFGEEYVLKEYKKASYVNFEQEAPILVRMGHPNVIQTVCLFGDEMKCGILMELMDEDLSKFLQHTAPQLSLLAKLNIMLQIAKGMEYVHSMGVIHRDLKPKNILVKMQEDGDGIQIKVTDFNDAKAKPPDSSSYTTKKRGTGIFRAPEVMADDDDNDTKYTKSADVYSFAMVCAQILSGKEPFSDHRVGSSKSELWRNISRGERPKLEDCPPYLRYCMQTWWQGESQQRPGFTEICRTLRHLIAALMRCPDPIEELPFLSWAENWCQAAHERAKESMGRWEERRSMRDWEEKGRRCDFTRVNEIPFEMYVMRMAVEQIPAIEPILEDAQASSSESQPKPVAIVNINAQVSINVHHEPIRPGHRSSPCRSFCYWFCCIPGPTLSTHMVLHE